ncbi:hypothetical protein BKI52_25625 [marine bacterium AO1-C]|nr:hypothetical protein BKI52_25625 [marine bacterium AO1-C]
MKINLSHILKKPHRFVYSLRALWQRDFLLIKSYPLLLLIVWPMALQAQTSEKSEKKDYKHHCFFAHQSVSVGIGAEYTTVFDVTGFNAKVYYNLGEKFSLGPEFSYFQKEEEEIFDYNLVVLHIFETPWVGLFPLIGGNYTQEKTESETKSAFGAVIGAGIHRNFNRFTIAIEYSRVFSELPDEFITFGVMFNIR